MTTRRRFLQASALAGLGAALPLPGLRGRAFAATQGPGLSDPALQPKFVNAVTNALNPGFVLNARKNRFRLAMQATTQMTGLVGPDGVTPAPTPVLGYGGNGRATSWPGPTIEARSGEPVEVTWENQLSGVPYPLTGKDNRGIGFGDYRGRSVLDTSLHWAYSLEGYTRYSVEGDGIPTVTHLHGGHTDFRFDGNPEFFYSPGFEILGPQVEDPKYLKYFYDNSQPAGTLWYHDHALGITRLNVYAGLAGFYLIRDDWDTGTPGNPLGLPAYPYEVALAIQDRMFKDNGELFYPAFPGDPFYADFITGEGAQLPPDLFPGGGPTGLAEFFGDHMVVNGAIWPKMDVESRNYRLRLLNGCDSRFLAVQFFEVPAGATDFAAAIGPIPFTVIGSDQGLAAAPTSVDTLLMETGARYDVVMDFKQVGFGNRVIMKNIGGDEPFGGDIPGAQVFGETDRIMAFNVVRPFDNGSLDINPAWDPGSGFGPAVPAAPEERLRKVALFEGKDEFGRLQPLLGTAEPATDYLGDAINWPHNHAYEGAVLPDGTPSALTGQMEGSIGWHSPTTENPALDGIEEWEIWNVTGDAHPVHLHLVHFEVLGRQEINWDSIADEDGFIPEGSVPADDGIYLVRQPVVQHNSVASVAATYGTGFRIVHPSNPDDAYGAVVPLGPADGYVENAPKDVVTALPGQITRIRARFDKPGRYVWHCHILSHEDHEMMRVLQVGPGA